MKHLLLATLMTLSVWAAAAVTTGEGEGVVIEVDQAGRSLVLEHGKIGDIMDPMTMPFSVDDAQLLDGVNVGDKVKFTLEWRQPDEFVITRMSVIPAANKH